MSNLKKMEQQLVQAGSVKGMLQLGFVKQMAVKNYESTTGRKDAENWFQQEAFAMMSIFNEKPELMKCEPMSIVACLVKAGVSGLRISDGHIDLVKYGNTLKADINYKGHREQLRKMADIKEIGEAVVVYKGDEFVEDSLNNLVISHKRSKIPEKITIEIITAAYVKIEFTNGTTKFVVMYHDEIMKAKNKSRNKAEDSPWNQWAGEMAKKTVIHRANKNYYRRPDNEVMIEPIEGADDDEVVDIPHKEQEAPAHEPQAPVNAPMAGSMTQQVHEPKTAVVASHKEQEEIESYLKSR